MAYYFGVCLRVSLNIERQFLALKVFSYVYFFFLFLKRVVVLFPLKHFYLFYLGFFLILFLLFFVLSFLGGQGNTRGPSSSFSSSPPFGGRSSSEGPSDFVFWLVIGGCALVGFLIILDAFYNGNASYFFSFWGTPSSCPVACPFSVPVHPSPIIVNRRGVLDLLQYRMILDKFLVVCCHFDVYCIIHKGLSLTGQVDPRILSQVAFAGRVTHQAFCEFAPFVEGGTITFVIPKNLHQGLPLFYKELTLRFFRFYFSGSPLPVYFFPPF